MDLITLAMAKAYTDSKASGGGGGSGLPFVQIDTPLVGVEQMTALSGAENAALSAAASSGMPAVVSVTLTAGDITSQICSVASMLAIEDDRIYVMPAPQDGDFHGVILLVYMGDAWGMTYISGSGYSE